MIKEKVLGFIVEGLNDADKLLRVFPNALFVVTKGTRYTNRTKMDINNLLGLTEDVFIITDPDDSGDILAAKILVDYDLPRIYLDKEQCKCIRCNKLKIGVEHADEMYLKRVILKQYGEI